MRIFGYNEHLAMFVITGMFAIIGVFIITGVFAILRNILVKNNNKTSYRWKKSTNPSPGLEFNSKSEDFETQNLLLKPA